MELNELKALMAASILSGTVACAAPGLTLRVGFVRDAEIEAAVKIAQRVWDEVVKQERE